MKSKILRVFAVLMVAVMMFSVSVFADSDVLLGDVNGDGVFDEADVTLMNRYLAGWKVTIVEENADMDGDGRITTWDLIMMERTLAGWY